MIKFKVLTNIQTFGEVANAPKTMDIAHLFLVCTFIKEKITTIVITSPALAFESLYKL